jgi:hypothetical protein
MRTEYATAVGLALVAAAALGLLAGCPGTLDDKDIFLLDGAVSDAPYDASPLADAGPADGAAKDGSPFAEAGSDSGQCGDVIARVFVPSCGGNGCHGAIGAQQGLDLVSPGVAARVVGVAAKECSATLADPKNPDNSLIYTKLSPNPPCGAQMPLARAPVSADDIACVRAWIAAQ